ncbi:serine O-acetyltransferase [Pseudonocardia oroxyli]|uniref:Serine O-acetyltransferase n=1 Tax=Pseudonocardia oroxyli TaxID=366584 RepID=A0A1G7ZBR7_PSEOR|nr:serine acetyltransferase [Pseudonocardia oroxyli]SDH06138.1 serine O-acetyltransferase [Pseudonocardia oroxyli]
MRHEHSAIDTARRVLAARLVPLVLAYRLTDRRDLIDADVERWQEVYRRSERGTTALLRCLGESSHEFRNLFYHRLRHGNLAGMVAGQLLRLVYRQEATLHLSTPEIGPGLFIQHGFATIVAAKSVGANCWINQQVTVGFKASGTGELLDPPVIGDDVTVAAGAIVLGPIKVGDGATVGANAVVVADVPPGEVAVGIPARNRSAGVHARNL